MTYKTKKRLTVRLKYIYYLFIYYITYAVKIVSRVLGFLMFLFGLLGADSEPFMLPVLLMVFGGALIWLDIKLPKKDKPYIITQYKQQARDYSDDFQKLYDYTLLKEINA